MGICVAALRRFVPALVVVAAAASACAAPPATGITSCPVRTEVTLEPTDPVNFSLVRAVSPEGGQVLLSHVEGDQLVFTLRDTVVGSASVRVGTLPYPTGPQTYPPLAAVSANGDRVVFGFAGMAFRASDPSEPLYRWSRSTGAVTRIVPPTVTAPPAGVEYPANARRLSADGARVLWTHAYFSAPSTFTYVLTVTDAATDQVVAQHVYPDAVPVSGTWTSVFDGTTSSDARLLTFRFGQYDTASGDLRVLTPELDAVQSAYGGGSWSAVASSPSGRWVLVQAAAFGPATETVNALWDSVAQEPLLLPPGNLGSSLTLTDAGTMAFTVEHSQTSTVYVRDADGSVHALVDRTLARTWPELGAPRIGSSTDVRTVVMSFADATGNRLVAERCA